MYLGVSVCVSDSDPDSNPDLTEWLNSIGVDSDVADKVRFAQFVFCYRGCVHDALD